MVRETYSKKDVGEFVSRNFVAVKINAEKGEGPKIAKRYGVQAFPTVMFIDSDGEEIDRFMGYRPPERFFATVKPILAGESFGAYKKRVARNPADFDAVIVLGKKYEERQDYDTAEKLYRGILDREGVPEKARARARGRIPILGYYRSRGENVAAVEKYFEENRKSDAAVDHANLLFGHYQRKEDSAGVIRAASYLLENGSAEDSSFLNSYAWYLATHDERLGEALKVAKKAVELSPEPYIIDTLAEAYHRNGKFAEAVKTQERAVKLETDPRQKAQFEKRLEQFRKDLEEKSRDR